MVVFMWAGTNWLGGIILPEIVMPELAGSKAVLIEFFYVFPNWKVMDFIWQELQQKYVFKKFEFVNKPVLIHP